MEPALHPDVIGGWWFPEDASVDARRLTCALRAACVDRGIQFMWGDNCAVSSLELSGEFLCALYLLFFNSKYGFILTKFELTLLMVVMKAENVKASSLMMVACFWQTLSLLQTVHG
jgi:hypothetical protein